MNTTTDQIITEYLEWAEHRARLSAATIKAYRWTLGKYAEWLGDRSICDVTFADVEDFGSRVRRDGPPSAASARRDIVVIRNLHDWASERDFPVRRVKSARAPKVADRVPKPLDDDVWLQLWESDLSPDDRWWLGLGYFCGLRRVEIVTISARDFDLDRGEMRFKRKGGSTQPIEYRAMIEIVAEELPHVATGWETFLGLLAEMVRSRHDDLWLWHDATGDIENDCNRLNKLLARKLCPAAGLPSNAVTPHRLRHSCATNLLRCGVEPAFIMDALSHSDISTTMKYMKTAGQLSRWKERKT
ncbi:MAG: tyrosine-type recombinase/integrase [Ilumatobacteraceae bacterium]